MRALVIVVAAACSSASAQQPTPVTVEMLGAMASLAGMTPAPAELATWSARLTKGEATLDAFIDTILANDRFGTEIMPSLLFGSFVNVRNYYAIPSSFVLKRSDALDAPLYLREPCSTANGVKVRPWWALETEVVVCPDAYRPEKWTMAADEHSYKTPTPLSCDSQIGSPEAETSPLCGCGPNLIRCARDAAHFEELNASLMREVQQTTAHVVANDLPMASLFTSNATFRDRNAELYYRRQKIGALQLSRAASELASLARWPEAGKWAPREELAPGQHAGVLTSPQILHWMPDRRQRQRGYYEILWCNLRNSFGATTHKVLEINTSGNNFFANDTWKQLAHTELCTNCHARLDYGFQFFSGYLDSRASTHFSPALQQRGTGPLYGEDIKDLRGEAPLTPAGFAKLATTQPDFRSCMSSHFSTYVLGDRATVDDIRAIEAAVTPETSFKAAMRVALVRFAQRYAAPAAAPSAAVAAAPPPPAATKGVYINAALRAQLDNHCVECHAEAPYTDAADTPDVAFDFTPGELPRPLLVSMADQVAFGTMPKGAMIDPQVRDDLVRVLIDTLWTDPGARAEAARYYLRGGRGLPAHQLDNALHVVQQQAGADSDLAWGALERGIWIDQSTITPSFLAITALDALRACERAGAKQAGTLEACLSRATALKTLSRGPVPAK